MSNFDQDSSSGNEWDERGELAWNEFDWEKYLREQDDVIHRYLAFYEQLRDHPERVDEVAHFMGWDKEQWSSEMVQSLADMDAESDEDDEDEEFDDDPYTLHKNPIFVSTKAIYLSLKRNWERIAHDATKVPQALALSYQTALFRGDENAMLAIQALDFGDYAMAISLFKRALRDLNVTLSLLSSIPSEGVSRVLINHRDDAMPRLFDLREIWLRVMGDCRQELQRPTDNSDESEK